MGNSRYCFSYFHTSDNKTKIISSVENLLFYSHFNEICQSHS